MRTDSKYSHLNVEECLIVHKSALWQEIQNLVSNGKSADRHGPFGGVRGRAASGRADRCEMYILNIPQADSTLPSTLWV